MLFSLFQTPMPDQIIPNGGTDSNTNLAGQVAAMGMNWASDFHDAESITVIAPTTLAETITFQGSFDGLLWRGILDLTATLVKGPTAANIIVYNGTFTGLNFLRLHAGGAVAADRIFNIIKTWRG